MSKQNKVNPGSYTQAGRLSQDDVARELKKQGESTGMPQEKAPPRVTNPPVTDEDNHEEHEGTNEHEGTKEQ